jgi:hypothetical protein
LLYFAAYADQATHDPGMSDPGAIMRIVPT